MRPVKLRFRGLHSYRAWQEVDFSLLAQGGLFGIFGPTGAGKSSVPDAITLALYGNVERASRGTQGIINLSEQSCEVAFTFELAGRVYTAQRLFERVKGDPFACRSEKCRLFDEKSGQVLADKPTELTAMIEGLLNMDMQRFCQTVILPQGKFDRFLRLKPAERGNMLEEIFHLQEYGDALHRKAIELVKAADAQLVLGEKELALLGECAPAQLEAADARLQVCRIQLESAAHSREQAQKAWQGAQALAAKEQERQEQQQQLEQLLRQEPQLKALAERAAAATKAAALKPLLEQVESRFREQRQMEQGAEAALLAQAAAAEQLRLAEAELETTLASLEKQRQQAQQQARQAEADNLRLTQEEQQLKESWQEAETMLEQARLENAAAVVAGHLRAGEACPVCGSLVDIPPEQHQQKDLAILEKHRRESFNSWQQRGKLKEEAAAALAEARQKVLALSAALSEAQSSEKLRLAREKANQTAWQAQQSAQGVAAGRETLEKLKQEGVEQAKQAGFESVNAARLALISPQELAEANQKVQQYREEISALRSGLERLNAQLAAFAADKLPELKANLEQAEDRWQALLVEEAGRKTALETMLANSLRWLELQKQQTALSSRRDTAKRLKTLLNGKAFVRFLARERLRELAAEASYTVGLLSNQHYSLQLFEEGEGGEFIIVDQYNAGQRRPVSSLSGGELFLVSLSLALALSRNIEMQGEMLGFFFLDEGFGTLDDDTLESVMGILERLPSDKRLVGLISHVAEVKARLPRYLEAIPADGCQGSVLRLNIN